MKKIYFLASILIITLAACSKKTETAPDTDPVTHIIGNVSQLRDSVFLYAKEDYYWADGLPDYTTFNPQSFTGTDDLTVLQGEINKLSQYKINPETNKPYEYYTPSPGEAKYSFIDDGTASARLNAVTGDFGFAPLYIATNDLRIKYVNVGSPADLAGVKRGYQITSINGRTAITYDGSSGSNVNFVINAYSQSSTITMVLKKPDGTSMTVNLNTASYKINPIITYKTFNQGNGKVVGYVVFNSFVSLSSTQSALNDVFSSFVTAGVTDLVVDLRYNGGGYVETAEYLSNLIAPSSANGSTMYSVYYNPTLTSNSSVLLKNQVRRDQNNQLYNYSQIDYSVSANTHKFSKKGALNVSRVFFIVSGSTASASELTINNVRPYMNVQLIGSTTYGKPVGFFDISIGKYKMYIPEFETKNAQGQGGYYSGMSPATSTYPGKSANDDATKEFGDPTEGLLAQAINYINKGVYITSTGLQVQSEESSANQLTTDQQNAFTQQTAKKHFNGMVMSNYVLKP